MHKHAFLLILISFSLAACNNGDHSAKDADSKVIASPKDTLAVFPVTDYLLGQLKTIEEMPVTPLRTVRQSDKTDSSWIKREEVRELAAPFLSPVIDSASLHQFFTGNSFLDQTVNAVTFTYSALPTIPENISLKEINVYIDPQTKEVQRVYLVKEQGDTTLQLTWKTGSWFSIRSINGNNIKEEKVSWSFNE